MSNNKYKILLIEDEANIRNMVQTILDANDYQTLTCSTCSQGLLMFSSHLPDLVLLDLGLPDANGVEFIKAVRMSSAVPIIIISARTQESDKVEALDLGANDYVTKPFGTSELMARIRAALRNSRHSTAGTLPGGRFELNDMVIDYDRRMVTVAQEEVHLTQTEYNILAFLSEHAGKMMTYSAIIQAIWGACDAGCVKKLQVNMANIRRKLGAKPGQNGYFINELGVGYRMYSAEDK
ncbi:MAG: response regulator transcription factor [Oscillospiraceae bacterium]|nr:response regulator transcription factor [Oscillospiraceae bacterium]